MTLETKTKTANATSQYTHPFTGNIYDMQECVHLLNQINQPVYRVLSIRNSSRQNSFPVFMPSIGISLFCFISKNKTPIF